MGSQQAVSIIETLRKQVHGRVVTPTDADYDTLRQGWNLAKVHHPAVILVADDVQDVIAGVNFAREAGLGVSIQTTGHGMQQPADDNLLIVTTGMTAVQVDAETRTAQVEAGAVWGQVVEKAAPLGLAPLLGSAPHVGVVGYTLGGGIGWLARKYGLAADSLRWIDVVTADGVLRRASLTENSDLFWGIRGGGSNFGVVTAMAFDLYPVASVYGGEITYPGAIAREALTFYREWIKTIPDELTSSIIVLKFPSLPQLPEALRGKTQVIMRAVYTGDVKDGAAYIQKWLDWRTPENNHFHVLPFSEIGTVSNDPVRPTAGIGSNAMFDELSDEAIDLIVRYTTDSASPLVFTELRHAGGAIARVAADANAIGNRDALLYWIVSGLAPSAEAQPAVKAYIRQYEDALRPYLRCGVYLNFVGISEEARQRVGEAYLPKTLERLRALKAQYDPDNVFRFSFQVIEAAK